MPTVLAVGAAGVCWMFLLTSIFSFSLSMGYGARGILKYCLKGPLNCQPKLNGKTLIYWTGVDTCLIRGRIIVNLVPK